MEKVEEVEKLLMRCPLLWAVRGTISTYQSAAGHELCNSANAGVFITTDDVGRTMHCLHFSRRL